MDKIKTIDDLYTLFLRRKFDKISKMDVLSTLKNTHDTELFHFLEPKYEFFIYTLIFGKSIYNKLPFNYMPRIIRQFNEKQIAMISYLYQKSLNGGSLSFDQYLNSLPISIKDVCGAGFHAYVENTDLNDLSTIDKASNVKNIVIIGLINPALFIEPIDWYTKLKDIHLLYPELFKIKMDHLDFCHKIDTIQLLKLNINDLDRDEHLNMKSDICFSN